MGATGLYPSIEHVLFFFVIKKSVTYNPLAMSIKEEVDLKLT